MGSDSIDCGCVGDLGMRIKGGHNGRVMETVAVDDLHRPSWWDALGVGVGAEEGSNDAVGELAAV